jgi:hypothetical protein
MPKLRTKTNEELLQAQIDELKRQNEMLVKRMTPIPEPGPFRPLWTLIRDHLRSVGGSASPTMITNALLKEGHNLGKYPLRSVKITVKMPAMQGVFEVSKDAKDVETVTLIDRPMRFESRNKWTPTDKKAPKRVRSTKR